MILHERIPNFADIGRPAKQETINCADDIYNTDFIKQKIEYEDELRSDFERLTKKLVIQEDYKAIYIFAEYNAYEKFSAYKLFIARIWEIEEYDNLELDETRD